MTQKQILRTKETKSGREERKLRILHIIPGLNNSSGPTQVVNFISQYAAEKGHEVTICFVTGRDTEPTNTFHSKVQLRGFSAQWFRYWAYSPDLQRYLFAHAGDFDLIHIHSMWLFPNLAAARAGWRAKVPYLVRPAGSLEPWCMEVSSMKKRGYLTLIERPILNRAAAIHAVSQQEAENIARMGFTAPILQVPNGIETAAFRTGLDKRTLRLRWNLPEDKFILLFLSRIHPKKNLEMLGRIFRQLLDQHPDVFLVIAGPKEHDYARSVQKLYLELGIDQASRFVGEVADQTKAEVYQAADCFVLPSHSENFGVVALEAMAAGRPALVSQNMPWAEVEQQEAGFWLPLDDQRWVESLGQLVENPDLLEKMGRNAEKLAYAYDWGQISEQLLAAYHKIADHDTKH